MRIYPAVHYTMGGLWVDYNLMSTVPGLHVLGEANFSDHGANRLGASALMQGLADGYFVIPLTIGDYLANAKLAPVGTDHPEFKKVEAEVERADQHAARHRRAAAPPTRSTASWARSCGRSAAWPGARAGLKEALARIPELRAEFWSDVQVPGTGAALNQSLEQAGRVADFLELGELMCRDALEREESCGGHFRVEHQTEDGEAKRDDSRFCYAAAWEWAGEGTPQRLNKEPLDVRERDAVGAVLQVSHETMQITLRVWRQAGPSAAGSLVSYDVPGVSPEMSFLEMLDVLNERLIGEGKLPIAFDHDCREGICGTCGLMINGVAHGPAKATTTCQLHMRSFRNGDVITVEPWRAAAFPVLADLVVDRRALDRIIASGGFIIGQHRRRARRQRDPGAQAGQRQRDGCGGVHRVRRLRGGVSQRLGVALHRGEGDAPGLPAAGPGGALPPCPRRWCSRWTSSTSGAARCTASAWRRAPRRSASTPSPA